LHPELAPREFKAFIREQTSEESLKRRNSGGGRVGRKKSMLRGEYVPSRDDGVGDGAAGGATGERREVASKLKFEELTISDLQRLEMLAGAWPFSFILERAGERC
jgi:hypothetical protein